MKNIIKITTVLVLLIWNSNLVKAQYVLKRADAQFELFNYTNAIKLYNSAYQKKKSLHATERLADSYRLVQDYNQAETWYATLVTMDKASAEATLQYAEILRQNAKYPEAKAQFIAYAAKKGDVSAAQQSLWANSCDSAVKWMKKPTSVLIKNQQNLNSAQSDWGTSMYAQQLVFASDRTNIALNDQKSGRPFLRFAGWESPSKRIYNWTGNGYLNLYNGTAQSDSVQLFPIKVPTDYHVGPASFAANGKEVYFTLTRIPSSLTYEAVGKNKIATINTEIYFSNQTENGVWSEPVAFKYNDVNKYSVGDPFLTKDGNRLYFVSNMEGGLGGSDIYFVERTADQAWGTPVSLLAANTAGNERTPAIGDDGNFYFASDGLIGMGGLDIFTAKLSAGNVSNIQNLAYPTNSPQDDFAYQATGKLTGFLSSNRTGGLGSDDIYMFAKQVKVEVPIFALEGTVFDKETNQPVGGARVKLNKPNGAVENAVADASGKFKFMLAAQSDYKLAASKDGYMQSVTEAVTTKGLTVSTVLQKDLGLGKIVIGKAIKIENIFYDFDKFNIRPDAATELDKLVETLNENPTIWIELGSHTDSRGNDAYNQKLSQNRANSAVAYIVSKGIAKERITAKGYGETMLVNECKNGVKCSAEAHQLNRRTEFKIVKY